MQITRTQIRKMILKEMKMGQLVPLFPMSQPSSQIDEFEVMTGVAAGLKDIMETVAQTKGAARVGRMGVGAPAGRGAADVVKMTAGMLDSYIDSVRTLADEDEMAFGVLSVLEALDRIVSIAADDPSAVRVAAMQIGRTISMSSDVLEDIESRYGSEEEL
jgi:hypothetical protein